MNIESFDDLLQAARQQSEPQQLLFVFAGAELPAGASAAQRALYEAGVGGELAPLMCVDKDPTALVDFAALATEAATHSPDWVLVFAAALPGRGGQAPTDTQVDAALQRMVAAVKAGQLSGLIPFDRDGQAVRLS
jgi:hypothetical protein